jgi:arylsulfatase A-like enzyme/Tfp pilus assembly protein PilF
MRRREEGDGFRAASPVKVLAALSISLVLSAGVFGGQPVIKRDPDLNVLLITVDTVRADHLGCYGYPTAGTPAIDGLAADGVRFLNAYAQVPLTLPSHSSIMTGTYPLYHQVHNNGYYRLGPENETLAKILKRHGYKTAAFVSSFTVDSRFGLAQGFDVYDERFSGDEILKNLNSERKSDQVYAAFASWFENAYRERFCCWVHFYDPHLPYDPPPPFKQEFRDHPYDGEIAFVDASIRRIVADLREKNVLERTLIIIAGDHGEALGEKREIDHGFFLYDGTLRVPLVLHAPRSLPRGIVVSPQVRLIDILPTVLDLLKLPVPKEIEGTSLLPYVSGKKREPLASYIETYFPLENFGWAPLVGIVDGQWKYIQAPTPELYDLKTDPKEEANLAGREKARAEEETVKLSGLIRKYARSSAEKKRTLTAEEEERLRSLGYLGGGPVSKTAPRALADPKDKIEDYLLYYRGNLMETGGHLAAAQECFEQVNRRNPEAPSFYVNLAAVKIKMNKVAEAVEVLERARAKFPDSPVILSPLMGAYIKAERWDDALVTGQAILDVDPRHYDALFLSGSVNARLGQWGEALESFNKALEIEPGNKTLRQRYAYALAASGRSEEALASFDRLIREYPADQSINLELGHIYGVIGNLDEARETLRGAVERHPSPEAFYAYAQCLARAGDYPEAVRWIRRYLETTSEADTPRKKAAQAKLLEWEKRRK